VLVETAPGGSPSLLYDVFISYAHGDREFVARLRGWLEAAGFRVWLDDERLRAGDALEETIRQALLQSEKAVFVLGEGKSPWSLFELDTFSQYAPERRKIAILRSALSKPTVYLIGDLHIPWHDEQEPDFSRFWRLYCGLREREPGKPEEWERKGREACRAEVNETTSPSLLSSTPTEEELRAAKRARWGKGRAVWGCDRTDQWMKIETHAAKPEHEALFVIGPRGEGHNYFLDTVEACFPGGEPERRVRKTFWGGKIPRDREEFLRALAETLNCRSTESAVIADSFRILLRDRNLVLVHRPVLAARLRDQALMLYYTRWLPELLPDPGTTRGVLKVIQGIDWSPSSLRGFLTGLGGPGPSKHPSPAESKSPAGETQKALQQIRAEAHERLPVFLLPPLKPINRKHVKDWVDSLPKSLVDEPKDFIRDVLEGAHHSADLLARIVERLSAAEEKA
jgi:TIR domain